MKKILLLILLLSQIAVGQDTTTISKKLLGNWEGAFLKSNSYQKLEIEFTQREGNIFGLQIMDEWHPTFGEFEVPVEIDSIGKIGFATGYGKAQLTIDTNNLELVGQIDGPTPVVYVHLKKVAKNPKPNFIVEEVSIASGENNIKGHLHIPNQEIYETAIIIVGGRGCYADETKYNLYAKFLRKYGISVLAYQKRGTGQSTGDCSKATIQELAADLTAVQKYLERHKNQYKNIGVLGISAGGWTMAKAEETSDFDFMISIVGPATSVKDQQLQSMNYGAQFYNLSAAAKEQLNNYTNLMFEAQATEKDFTKMQELLSLSERENWKPLLDDTDIPKSISGISELWVRRHDYDPQQVLSNYDKPFLAIYGDRDWIVPYKENVNLLKKYFSKRLNNLSTIVAYNAEHGMEMESKWVDLGNDQSYWHFYRISPEVRIEIVNFLTSHKLVK